MRYALGFFGLMVVAFILVAMTRGGSDGSSQSATTQSMNQEKQAIMVYKLCESGHTVETATGMVLKIGQAQSISPIRYVTHDAKVAKYAIPYKAQNGAERSVDFNYTPSTGNVNAENDDGLAVLRLMQAGCR